MFPDMQSQFKDFWFFRKFLATFNKIQSSEENSVRLIIETLLIDRTSFIKQHVREKPKYILI